MDFPKPEYVKSFVSKKMNKKTKDYSLMENDELARETDEIQRSDSPPDHIEMSNRINKYTEIEEDKPFNSKSPLQLGGANTKHYGTTHGDVKAINTTSSNRGTTSVGSGDGRTENMSSKSSSFEGHAESPDHHHDHDHDHGHSHSSTTSLDSSLDSDHCHEDNGRDEAEIRKREKALRKIIIAAILCFFFMCGEILGGYLANSLAIMTDASHLLTDVSSFLVSIIALRMAAKPSSPGMTFGWYRAEIIGALTSVLTIWILTGILLYFAVQRLIHDDYDLNGMSMLITASCAVIFNIIMGAVLHEHGHGHLGHSHSHSHSHKDDEGEHEHSHDEEGGSKHKHSKEHKHAEEESGNVNVRAAFIHVLGDLLQSIGVLIAAFIIYFKPEYKIADPICTFLFSILVLATTITVLRDTIVVIMEGKPTGIGYEKVKENLLSLEGVVAVHDLRIWSLTLNQIVMSCHLAIGKQTNSSMILKLATKKMKSLYDFHSMTIQVEQYSQDMDDCKKCKP